MYNFCFSGNPIFENKKGADEPTKAEVKNMSKKGKIRVALGSLLALTLVVTSPGVRAEQMRKNLLRRTRKILLTRQ